MADLLALLDVGHVALAGGDADGLERIVDGVAVMRVSAGVDDDAVARRVGLLNGVDDRALVVGLEKFHFHAHLGAAQLEVLPQTDIIQLPGPPRLGEVHHVEVGAVND